MSGNGRRNDGRGILLAQLLVAGEGNHGLVEGDAHLRGERNISLRGKAQNLQGRVAVGAGLGGVLRRRKWQSYLLTGPRRGQAFLGQAGLLDIALYGLDGWQAFQQDLQLRRREVRGLGAGRPCFSSVHTGLPFAQGERERSVIPFVNLDEIVFIVGGFPEFGATRHATQ